MRKDKITLERIVLDKEDIKKYNLRPFVKLNNNTYIFRRDRDHYIIELVKGEYHLIFNYLK